ncbi:putative nuclease HARBI1 isoform X2 [Tanacetum coccineum]
MKRCCFTPPPPIVRDLSANCPYFQEGCDAVGKAGISALVKCTSAIRQLAYAAVQSLDKIIQINCVLMKSISQPGSNDVKRIRYKQAHEAARKDVERAFGVLKKKWAIVRTPAQSRSLKRITHLMYTCIILHNMIRKEKEKAISPDFYPEEQHREDDPNAVEDDGESEKSRSEVLQRSLMQMITFENRM